MSLAEYYGVRSRHRVLRRMDLGWGGQSDSALFSRSGFSMKFDGLKNTKHSASLKGEEDWVSLTETG